VPYSLLGLPVAGATIARQTWPNIVPLDGWLMVGVGELAAGADKPVGVRTGLDHIAAEGESVDVAVGA
jgi:hypothetical protein